MRHKFIGQNHVAMGPTRQEWAQEAAARPHPGNGAEGRARAVGANQRRAKPGSRTAAASRRCRRLGYKLNNKQKKLYLSVLLIAFRPV